MANLIMQHWFRCFAEKKIFKDSKDSSQRALKVVYNSNRNYDGLLWDNNEISVHQRLLRAL